MSSTFEQFFSHSRYAVVGHSAKAPFPKLTYGALKKNGKEVFAVDPEADTVEGDKAFRRLADVPVSVDGVVLEVPKDEVIPWLEEAAALKVQRVWLHMNRETPEALEVARQHGLELCYGTCAVQYLDASFPHIVHRYIRKMMGRY